MKDLDVSTAIVAKIKAAEEVEMTDNKVHDLRQVVDRQENRGGAGRRSR
jgi:hypothetical protein